MRRFVGIAVVLAALGATAHAGAPVKLHDGWQLQSACKFEADGAAISAASFTPSGWLKTTVPATVLAAQAAAGVVPDPYYGSNLRKLDGVDYPVGQNFSNLPMPKNSPYRCGWWYRTTFSAPAAKARDERQWLHFGGINYRAQIWLNGKQIADEKTVAGAYRIYDFDVTGILKPGAENVLAVETFAPTEKDLGINWVDWNPCPPDKDMGLWGDVELKTAGPVSVRTPLVETHFADDEHLTADLAIYANLHNAADHAVKGVVSGTAAGARFEKTVELKAGESQLIAITPADVPALKIRNPKLWWPWQMGEAHLERLTIAFTAEGRVSDETSAEFGIREVTSELTTNGSRLFRVNGKPILIRGAGWSQDMLLRSDSKRLAEQFRLVRDMNLNTIRLEGKLETEEFFHLADQQGILVMAGWCCCDHWEMWKDWTPEDLTIATASLRAQLERMRIHPSVFVWLNGSDNAPPADVERAYLNVESEVRWPNPVLSAAQSSDTPGGGLNGVKMTGPYDYVAPSYWYVDKQNGGAYGFNTETSPGPAIPSLASRRKFLPDADVWPPTANWSLHNGGTEFATTHVMDAAMDAIYATPKSAAEYERMAQTMAYDTERAMFEAYGKNKYNSTGVIQWMLNNAWPSMIWHLYDYNLEADAGYFATKKACEPVHIQYAYDDHTVQVVSSIYDRTEGLKATVSVHGIGWNKLYEATAPVDAAADSVQRVFQLPDTIFTGSDRIFFIDLELKDAAGKVVSRNFYWVPGMLTSFDWGRTFFTHTPAARHEDMRALTQLPAASVTAKATVAATKQGRELNVTLENSPAALAFQVNVAARTATGDLIAPVFWEDNWIELVPGEKRTLTALLPENAPANVSVELEGWNVAPIKLAATKEN
jgi:exo-1,4-beta-D-glucosaminidase